MCFGCFSLTHIGNLLDFNHCKNLCLARYLRGCQLLWCVHAYWIYMRTSRCQIIKDMIILLSTLKHFQCRFSSPTCAFSVLCLIPAGLLAWPSLHWAPCWHQSAPLQFELCEGVPSCQQHRLLCSYQQPSGLLLKKSNTSISFNRLIAVKILNRLKM